MTDEATRIADLFNVPPHLVADLPRKRAWRLHRARRRLVEWARRILGQ